MNKSNIWEVAKVIIISVLLATIVRTFIIQPFAVRGASMNPNFFQNDYLIIDKISYRISEPKRGDVIVFKAPKQINTYYIKRIIALPEEEIEIINTQVKIFNKENPQGIVLNESTYKPLPGNKTAKHKLKEKEYYVLGDNRRASSDSTVWGPLQQEKIIGKVVFRAWPINSLDIFTKINY